MSVLYVVVALVALQRLAELVHARRNEAGLRARGGVEVGARHYPFFVLLHGSSLLALAVLVDPAATVNWPLLGLYLVLQAGRIWVVASLGPYWTTRIITVPDAPLVRTGPYRWFRHPNYLVVVAEIAVLPLAFGAWRIAIVFSALNAALLWHRIRVETAALAARDKR